MKSNLSTYFLRGLCFLYPTRRSLCPLSHRFFSMFSLKSFIILFIHSFSSVAQSCPTLCDPKDCSTTGLPVPHHQHPEFIQTHVHQVGDAIQPSHPLSSPFPPAFNLSQHQGLFLVIQFFTSGGQSIRVSAAASVLPMISCRIDWLHLLAV